MLVRKQINPGVRILAHECEAEGFKSFAYEYVFAPPRKWRFDLCWPILRVAFERDGGTWQKSRHTSGTGFRKDVEKLNAAAALGWFVVRGTADMMADGSALVELLAVLRYREKEQDLMARGILTSPPTGRTKPQSKEGRRLN